MDVEDENSSNNNWNNNQLVERVVSKGTFSKQIRRGTLEHVQFVSKRAALAGKRKIWDTNDAPISAALSAVDHWESTYSTLKSILVTSFKSAQHAYITAKSGAEKIEHSLLVPVRDYVILPTFGGVERAVATGAARLSGDEAHQLVQGSLSLVRRTPFVGESVLAPLLIRSGTAIRHAWEIVQYPIPSRRLVIDVTDAVVTNTKRALMMTAREFCFYVTVLDATMTRTWSHTQWRVLGSGPYVTLDDGSQRGVLDHLCERYFSCGVDDEIGRYELAAHIRCQNGRLFEDLRVLLLERGSEVLGCQDEWLKEEGDYRHGMKMLDCGEGEGVKPLWFYLKNVNGEPPKKDVKWTMFTGCDAFLLEQKYRKLRWGHGDENIKTNSNETLMNDESTNPNHHHLINNDDMHNPSPPPCPTNYKYSTIAKWYTPCKSTDVLVDQDRHAISFTHTNNTLKMIQRPTLWRFHGPGDNVRRGLWLLHTKNSGLQPFDESQALILEDAYLFLRWRAAKLSSSSSSRQVNDDNSMGGVLLTVQVMGPTGVGQPQEVMLVQFRSLTKITAIRKTLGGALMVWKWRVYRGVSVCHDDCDINNDYHYHHCLAAPSSLLSPELVPLEHSSNDNDDNNSDNISHLILVVHGIGEMLRTLDLFGMSTPALSTIIDCCSYLRNNHADVDDKHGINVGRVEYIPVEWHEAFAVHSRRSQSSVPAASSNVTTVRDISLRTIPHLRTFANDSLLDVLYFMTPEHHDVIIDIVTSEMNYIMQRLNWLSHSGFKGKVSIMAHSLGSIIAWDILSHQSQIQYEAIPSPETSFFTRFDSFFSASQPYHPAALDPSLLQSYPQLSFPVSNAFLLGSPLPIFLLIRNEHLSLDYTLPGCPKLFNIFHPYDPAAYRLEPLLHPHNAESEPELVPHWKTGGFRVHYRTKFLWNNFLNETQKKRHDFVKMIEQQIHNMGLLDDDDDDDGSENNDWGDDESSIRTTTRNKVKCGRLNQGRRVDYMLQEREIENANEYVFALGAHSAYWDEKDLSLFVAREIWRGDIDM